MIQPRSCCFRLLLASPRRHCCRYSHRGAAVSASCLLTASRYHCRLLLAPRSSRSRSRCLHLLLALPRRRAARVAVPRRRRLRWCSHAMSAHRSHRRPCISSPYDLGMGAVGMRRRGDWYTKGRLVIQYFLNQFSFFVSRFLTQHCGTT